MLNNTHPFCILQEPFVGFLSPEVFKIFLPEGQYCVHMGLVLHGKFKGPKPDIHTDKII